MDNYQVVLDALNFGLSLYLHNSLCVRVVKVVEMLRTSADASVHGLVKYSLHIKQMSCPISLQSGHSIMTSCGCSHISV